MQAATKADTRVLKWSPVTGSHPQAAPEAQSDMVIINDEQLDVPLRHDNSCVFSVGATSDIFQPEVPFDVLAGIFGIMAAASWHTFQISTKHPERALDFLSWVDFHTDRNLYDCEKLQQQQPGCNWRSFFFMQQASELLPDSGAGYRIESLGKWPLPNVWIGLEVQTQQELDERFPDLMRFPACHKWLSIEPLSSISLRWMSAWPRNPDGAAMNPENGGRTDHLDGLRCLDWVVVSGETGPKAQPSHPDWIRALRDECAQAGVPFMFAGWGEWGQATGHFGNQINPSHGLKSSGKLFKLSSPGQALCGAAPVAKVGVANSSNVLDGKVWSQTPADLVPWR
jgi:protein gp37